MSHTPEELLPYVVNTGALTKALEKIQTAATPTRFTQEFLASKLGMPGGGPKAVIPYFKRVGLLGSDGAPTDLYRRFRNQQQRGSAAAEALRGGYATLFAAHEAAHDLRDTDLRDLVAQVTGVDKSARSLTAMVASFKTLRTYGDFDGGPEDTAPEDGESPDREAERRSTEDREREGRVADLNIGYTINLHLPATSDIAVFNAIFRSLRENLLR